MPERIRSAGFAFLGLTAAAGLAVVAVFAQMGFPLLPPSPLPDSPAPGSVSKAVPLARNSAAAGVAQAQGAPVTLDSSGQGGSSGARRGDRDEGIDRSATPVSNAPSGDAPGPSDPVAPAPPAATPAPAPAPSPTPVAEPAPAPVGTPVSTPQGGAKPEKETAVDSKPHKPEAKPAAAEPSKPEPRPVGAKPAKAKSAKAAKEAKPEAAAPEASYVPAPAAAESGKGKEKDEKDEKDK